MSSIILETDRSTLRPFVVADASALGPAMRDANITETTQFEPPARTVEEGAERALARITDFSDHWERFGFGVFGAFRKDDGGLIGYCGLRYNDEFDGDLHISTMVDRPYWSCGIASEIFRRNLEFAFLEQDFKVVYGAARTIQLTSVRILEKCGFVRQPDRMLRHYPMVYYACSREAFLAQHVIYLKFRLGQLGHHHAPRTATGLASVPANGAFQTDIPMNKNGPAGA